MLKQTGQDETHCKGQLNPDLKNDEPHCLLPSLAQVKEKPVLSVSEPMDGFLSLVIGLLGFDGPTCRFTEQLPVLLEENAKGPPC